MTNFTDRHQLTDTPESDYYAQHGRSMAHTSGIHHGMALRSSELAVNRDGVTGDVLTLSDGAVWFHPYADDVPPICLCVGDGWPERWHIAAGS